MSKRTWARTCKMLAAAAASVLGLGGAAQAAIISVNFAGGQTDPGSGGAGAANVTGVAGAVPAGAWNNATSNTASGLVLNDSTGTASASVSYTVNNTWAATGAVPGTDDANMMNGYLDNYHNAAVPITVTGLGSEYTSGGYDVLVYQNSDSAGSFGYTVTAGLVSGTRFGRQLAGGGGNYPLAGGTNGYIEGTATTSAGDATASNYVRIRGLTASSFTITGVLGTSGDGRVRPNGFQIVSAAPIPEPSAAVTVAALASTGLLARRRRQ